ncbi:Gfo/Idh/MocA family oxidoreductase [Candidatus Sumerlaeota bacterium]|nr:Gfo/Idh/MocA family oxidoreductase [Candidatus Sumerlaeota bacterium]
MGCSAKIGRKEFLRRAAVLGASGALGPVIIPQGVLASAGAPGANDRIGIAGIGIGRQGSAVLNGMAGRKEVRFVAIADASIVQARKIAAKYKAEPYQDYRKLLERKDVDAIVTATPDHWRSLVCIHACQAGKDVYAEKPMTLTIREGRLMVQAVRKYERVFQTGSQQRSMAANRLGCELIRNKRIGKISRVIAHNYPSPWECGLPAQPAPEGLDWDMWCGPTEVVPFNADLYTPRANPGWISFRPYSGGEMTGWGAHGLDQVQWALGMDESGPIEVWTEGEKFNPPTYTAPESAERGNKICSVPKVFFRYADDIVMELGPGPSGGAIFFGEKGQIMIDRAVLKSDPPEIAKEPIRSDEIHLIESSNHYQNWLDCIKSRKRPIADAEIGHRSATVCHLGNIARWVGRRLRWDPVKEVFPDDPEANKFLDRPHRKPYELPRTI